MSRFAVPQRSTAWNSQAPAILTVLAAALIAAFVAAPATLAGGYTGAAGQRRFIDAADGGFVEYWKSGVPRLSPRMQSLVDYWLRYHVAKAVIAAILLVVLTALAVIVWRAFLSARGAAGRRTLAGCGVGLMTLALVSLAAVMANVQGAIAPLSSLLTLLPVGAPDAPLAETLGQVRHGLAETPAAGVRRPPALQVMISDFAAYHVVVAVLAALLTLALLAGSAVAWRRARATERSDRRARRLLSSFAIASALLALAVGALAVANTGVAADPEPALLAFFNGGW